MIVTYPTTAELRTIEQEFLPVKMLDDPVLRLFAPENLDSELLIWTQRDDYLGLTQIRGMNGSPPRVKAVGAKEYIARPGYYGEHDPIDEAEMTRRRAWGSSDNPIDISDIVRERQDKLLHRRINRMRWICWKLLVDGVFSVLDDKGAILHSDSYMQRAYAASVPWATVATATPLANFGAVQRMSRGYSVNFGASAMAFMNTQTFEYMRLNNNTADLYGRRTQGLGSYNSLGQINDLLTGDGLPRIVLYDEGYKDDNGTFQLFIPDNRVVVVGARNNGDRLGSFLMTRNINNPGGAAGPYAKIIDTLETRVPRSIEVHTGFNGGPALFYPSAIVVMYV